MTEPQWEQLLAIGIPGDPMPAPRPRAGQGRVFMPSDYRHYRDAMAFQLKLRRPPGEWPDVTGQFAVKLMAYRRNRHRVDVDNLVKTVLDAGTVARIWLDDSQVVKLIVQKFVDREKPRSEIRIWRLLPVQEALVASREG